jgi:hypothetical protein
MIFGIIKQGIKTIYTAISDKDNSNKLYEKIADYCHGCEYLEYNAVVRDINDQYKNKFICKFDDMKNAVPGKTAQEIECPHVRQLERNTADCRGCMHMSFERELETWHPYCNKHIDFKKCKYEK